MPHLKKANTTGLYRAILFIKNNKTFLPYLCFHTAFLINCTRFVIKTRLFFHCLRKWNVIKYPLIQHYTFFFNSKILSKTRKNVSSISHHFFFSKWNISNIVITIKTSDYLFKNIALKKNLFSFIYSSEEIFFLYLKKYFKMWKKK